MKIKFLVISLVAMLATSGVVFAASEPTLSGWENKSKYAQQAGEGTQVTVLKLVRNSAASPNSTTISSGSAVVYDTVSDDGITVRTTTTSADGAFAGIAVTSIPSSDNSSGTTAAADAGHRNFGWIIVHGKTTATVTAGGTNGNAVGDFFITSGDAGTITTMMANTEGIAQNTELKKMVRGKGGFFLDAADTTSTSVDVFVEKE